MVEIIPKEVPKLPGWLNILFYFSLILLVSAIASYFSLNNSLKKSQEELSNLELLLLQEITFEKFNLEKEIFKDKSKIEDFSYLIDQHLESSKIFNILEKISHPKVWFLNFDLNSQKGVLELSGEAQNFESLGQQILILNEEKSIKDTNLKNISITKEGKVGFNISLSLEPEILK